MDTVRNRSVIRVEGKIGPGRSEITLGEKTRLSSGRTVKRGGIR